MHCLIARKHTLWNSLLGDIREQSSRLALSQFTCFFSQGQDVGQLWGRCTRQARFRWFQYTSTECIALTRSAGDRFALVVTRFAFIVTWFAFIVTRFETFQIEFERSINNKKLIWIDFRLIIYYQSRSLEAFGRLKDKFRKSLFCIRAAWNWFNGFLIEFDNCYGLEGHLAIAIPPTESCDAPT